LTVPLAIVCTPVNNCPQYVAGWQSHSRSKD
jgi:hypothetical protein